MGLKNAIGSPRPTDTPLIKGGRGIDNEMYCQFNCNQLLNIRF